MGEVYKARDTRLDRTVAIKVMPSHLSEVLVDTQSASGFATDSSVTDWSGAHLVLERIGDPPPLTLIQNWTQSFPDQRCSRPRATPERIQHPL